MKKRADGQISGLAGELFVAAELLKRDIQTSVTFGNAKAIDLFAYNPITEKSFNIQVKTLRTKNYYPLKLDRVHPKHIYVFVLLNKPGEPVRYFILPGQEIISHPEKFGKDINNPVFPCIDPKHLIGYENNWSLFSKTD